MALLLWGVHMVQTGVQRAFGARLRGLLAVALRGRLKAFAAGVGVTAILQSSTATGLMVAGFASAGLVELVPALAVMLGANVGTTLIVQALSFNVSEFAPALILLGVLLFRRASAGTRDFGRVLIGLGLMLMALRDLLALVTPYEDVPSLRMLLGAIATEPLLDVVVAAGLTWAAHSSVAVVLLVMSLAAKGVVPPHAAYALVLGANLGTAINPLLEATTGNDPAARRVPLGNLLNRLVGVSIALALLSPIGLLMVRIQPDNARSVADFHVLFNLVLATISLPLLPALARLLCRLLPERLDPADPSRPLYLDQAAIETPVVALGGAAREALRMADVLEVMLLGLRDMLDRPDRRRLTEARAQDDILDRLNTAIKTYLVTLDNEAMTEADHRRAAEIMAFAMNLEQAGDVLERNLLGAVAKGIKRGVTLPMQTKAELTSTVDRLIANTRLAASLFMSDDVRGARLLAAEKRAFRDIEAVATTTHFDLLRHGQPGATDTSSFHLDMLRDLKQVNAHLVAAAANPVLERMGELLPSRLRAYDDPASPAD